MMRRVRRSGFRVSCGRAAPFALAGVGLLVAGLWFGSAGCAGSHGPGQAADSGGAGQRTAMERNADCCMCHQPFLTEPLSLRHAKQRIACEDCHGASRAHSTDEKFQAPPDVVIKPNGVDSFCLRCHSAHKAKKPPRDSFMATNPGILGKDSPTRCTACHGRHRIARTTTRP